ncbi:MAG TPA: RluA family pseudouridine synthase [Thermoanaerobaculia bacterium]
MRLDLAVARRFGLSRRAARDAVRSGRIESRGQVRDEPGTEVADDVPLQYDPNRPAERRVLTRLTVLAEDPLFLIVDKPAGLLTVQTAEHEEDTLFARVLDYLQHRYRRRTWIGVVHRLDKETSGALLFARTRDALRNLQEKFRAHAIEREYVALVEGNVVAPGTFDAPLVSGRRDRRRGVARPGESGKRAVTHYRPLESFGRATLVSVQLETGRTHQVRVHFASAGHPVIGDSVYRRGEAPPLVDVRRQMLHARVLGFEHPKTGAPVRAEAPIPEDFGKAIAELRRRARKSLRDQDQKKAPRNSGRSVKK